MGQYWRVIGKVVGSLIGGIQILKREERHWGRGFEGKTTEVGARLDIQWEIGSKTGWWQ